MVLLLIALVVIYLFLDELSRGGMVFSAAEPHQKRRNRKKYRKGLANFRLP